MVKSPIPFIVIVNKYAILLLTVTLLMKYVNSAVEETEIPVFIKIAEEVNDEPKSIILL